MTEVLLLLVAVLLSLACGAFVAAEFSLTTVERSELGSRAVERGERGASGALKAARNLTVPAVRRPAGITVTNLVVGMLSESSIAKLIAGPRQVARRLRPPRPVRWRWSSVRPCRRSS